MINLANLLVPGLMVWIGRGQSDPHLEAAKAVVARLSAELHVPVAIEPELGRHVVLLARHGCDPKTALQAVALCLRAEVTPRTSGLTIARNGEEIDKTRAGQCHERARRLEDRMAEIDRFRSAALAGNTLAGALLSTAQRSAQDWQDRVAKRSQVSSRDGGNELMPCQILLEKLVQRIGPERLATETEFSPRVYEDDPTVGAESLPDHTDLLAQYAEAIGGLRAAAPVEQLGRTVNGLLPDEAKYYDSVLKESSPVARLRLRVESVRDTILCTLECYDVAGKLVDVSDLKGAAQTGVAPKSPAAFMTASEGDHKRILPIEDPWIDLLKHAGSFAGLPEWTSRPETQDPQDPVFAPVLAELANEDSGSCVAFDVTDNLHKYAHYCDRNGRFDVDAMESMLTAWKEYERVRSGKAVAWRPVYFDGDELGLADRGALGTFMRACRSAGHSDFRKIAVLYHDASPQLGPIAATYSQLFDGGQSELHPPLGSDRLFALAGGISDLDWDRLLSGSSMTIAELGLEKEFTALLREDRVRAENPNGSLPDLYCHPAELFRGAEDFQPYLTLQPEAFVVESMTAGAQTSLAETAWSRLDALATFLHVNYRPDRDPAFFPSRDQVEQRMGAWQIRLARWTAPVLTIHLPKGCVIRCSLPHTIESPSEPMRFQDLPEALRDQLWALATKSAKRRYDGMAAGSSGPGATAAPPPPAP